MGRKWSRNVTDYGLGDTGASLCSRMLAFPPRYILTNVRWTIGAGEGWELPVFPHLPYSRFNFHGTAGFINFPFGIPVEPDAPV